MIFVLDIGTRSIVGLWGTLKDEKIIIKHAVVEYHKKRAMYDGQIHDIEGVTQIVKRVKEKMEEKIGIPLKEVCIAAAGRALKTSTTIIEKDLDEYKEIDKDLIGSIEIEGIQQAHRSLERENSDLRDYFCVGHTVINYYLNDGLITNPLGHKGKKLKLEMLATFLPKVVVDSLYTVMTKVGLEVSYLTLEPIAAIEVAVPENMRLLNIALVDIGAGTSDIAITKDGTVTAYGMTSIAGDEITEELARAYLLDFDTAEKIKCNLYKEEEQNFTDILGINHTIKSEEILDKIEVAIISVAKEIANTILSQNGRSPSVVFLIGGGSQIPRINTWIANELQLPKERVVVRGIDMIQNLQWDTSFISGPEGMTPVGILLKSLKNKFNDFIEVEINNKKIKMLKTKKLKISDALALIDFNPRDLLPKKGKNLKVYLNNQEKIIFGEYGETASITINGKTAHLDTLVENGDKINLIPATIGKDAEARLGEILNLQDSFKVNGNKIYRYQRVKVQGKEVSVDYLLQEGDKIEFIHIDTIKDLCEFMNIKFNEYDIYIKGQKVSLYTNIEIGGEIELHRKKKISEAKPLKKEEKSIEILYNGKPLKISSCKKDLIFVDLFNFVDFDRTKVKGTLVLKHNGIPANYTDPLKDGDEIWVYWQ